MRALLTLLVGLAKSRSAWPEHGLEMALSLPELEQMAQDSTAVGDCPE